MNEFNAGDVVTLKSDSRARFTVSVIVGAYAVCHWLTLQNGEYQQVKIPVNVLAKAK